MEKIKISKLKLNPKNPRFIRDEKFEKLKKSITEFPQMMDLRPIVVDDEMVILGGNMRYRACLDLGWQEVPFIKAKDLTEEQKQEFIIKDNVPYGEWDWELLANEWDQAKLEEWGLELPNEPKDISDTLETDFKIEISFENENDQSIAFDNLTQLGYKCRVLTL